MQFPICQNLIVGRIVTFPDNCGLITPDFEVPIQTVVRGIQGAVLKPFNGDIVGAISCIFDLGIRLEPINAFALFPPKGIFLVLGGDNDF